MPHFVGKMVTTPYASPSPPQYPLERKLKKPLMEKRRRARMNECLDQLKHLLLHISPNHRTKLEKADILEMTVAYLNQMQQPPSPSTSFDNNAIYQQSYAEGFSVAASACLNYLQNTLLPGEFAPQAQKFRIGLMQHLQYVMSSRVNASAEDRGTLLSHSVVSQIPASLQTRSPLAAGTYIVSNYLSNPVYSRIPSVTYQPNVSALCGSPLLCTAISTPWQSKIPSTPENVVPRPVVTVGAQPTFSGFCSNDWGKCVVNFESTKKTAVKSPINELGSVGRSKDVKVWRPF